MGDDMLGLVNQARRKAGVKPLRCSNELQAAALRHSRDIAHAGKMEHKGEWAKMLQLQTGQVAGCNQDMAVQAAVTAASLSGGDLLSCHACLQHNR